MAPEQIRDQQVDRRADIWSLGVCLWELLVGKSLFRRGSTAQTIERVTEREIPSARFVRPSIPELLDDIVMKALARDPAERHSTARELGRELHRFIAAQGDIVTVADIAECMEQLFPAELDSQRRRAERAHRDSAVVVAPVAEPQREVEVVAPASEVDEPQGEVKAVEPGTSRPAVVKPLVVGIGLACGLLAASAWWLTTRPSSEPVAGSEVVAQLPEVTPATPPRPAPVVPPSVVVIAPLAPTASKARTSQITPHRPDRKPIRPAPAAIAVVVVDTPPARTGSVGLGAPADTGASASVPQTPPPSVSPATVPTVIDASIGELAVQGSLVPSVVRRAIDRALPSFRACVRSLPPATAKLAVRVRLVIDELGHSAAPSVDRGGSPALDACLRAATTTVRSTTRPDTGTVDASFVITFTSH